jgi:ABC-type transport system involved in multi-copper enzyme maturation permease subunit
MSSKAITEKPEHEGLAQWETFKETAPSVMTADVPTVARGIGFVGLLLLVGGIALVRSGLPGGNTSDTIVRNLGIPGALLVVFLTGGPLAFLGFCGLVYHAARETDAQIRRVYLVLGGVVPLIAAVVLAFYPVEGVNGAWFLPWGALCLIAGLLFLLPTVHGEEDENWRRKAVYLVGAVGAVLAVVGLVGSNIPLKISGTEYGGTKFLSTGLLLGLLGLAYLWGFVGLQGSDSDLGHRTAKIVGWAGVAVLLVGLARSILTRYGWLGVERDLGYLPTAGSLLMGIGIIYAMWGVLVCSDSQVAVVARRELGSYFYTPVAYFLMIGLATFAWFGYGLFVDRVVAGAAFNQPMVEPIVKFYIFGIIPVMFFTIQVPLLTMRQFSEEARSGTLEMLMTVPIQETAVVLGKFWAAMIIFLLTWLPFGLYLVGLRMVGGQPFDYRPIISFFIALICSGAGAIAVGLFFSSLSKSQLVGVVLTGMFMVLLLFGYFATFFQATPAWAKSVLRYVNYVELWGQTLDGKLILGNLFFPVALAIVGLFATVKVLEARKWW